ncbi:hypothetical protein ASPSYDRAFT_57233 [Aspergillus sydowii CBS 593.65]|uniref:Ornithine aminotransferase n=1 Tax=Aspergillus sydowii CBS 593.65 TaxID=1036612 RepID=A0A1L9TK46_9EURO|nr:uncharacterized protein ASPSYDRAFT_57233 [Aspergillus sydowii CBS 593.65]OJJ59683.1 hypothetical protein ASPSYDRAFT_57233 [Aspergillus sydowii CBS 593.65]
MAIDSLVSGSHVLHRSSTSRLTKFVAGNGTDLVLEDGTMVIDASCGPSIDTAYVYSISPYTNEVTGELASILLSRKPGGALAKAIFSCHGDTIAALFVSGHEERRGFYRDFMAPNVSFLDPCYACRMEESEEMDAELSERLASQYDDQILRFGPGHNLTLGRSPAVEGYFGRIRDICDQYDVLLILDEEIRGPGIQTTSKIFQAGFVPLSGVFLYQNILDALFAGSGRLAHGHTFQASRFFTRRASMGQKLEMLLRREIGPLPLVGDIRGRGLFWAAELLLDKRLKTETGLEVDFCGQFQVDHVLVCPPYIVTDEGLEEIISPLKSAIVKTNPS